MSNSRLIRIPEVMQTVGIRRTKIYELINEGEFPAPVKVGRASFWRSHEIDAWVEQLQHA